VRGAPIVRRTLDSALVELARVGYAALRVDDVATRARVNKTTVYRRWPTKEALVVAALLSIAERHASLEVPDTGSLRGDLLEVARRRLAFMQSREGRVVSRMVNADAPDPGLLAIIQSLRQAHEAVPYAIIERAKKRLELRADVDPAMFVALFHLGCTLSKGQSPPQAMRCRQHMIDLLLSGALRPPARRATSGGRS
jgi:AcrR family transcriptional regulator